MPTVDDATSAAAMYNNISRAYMRLDRSTPGLDPAEAHQTEAEAYRNMVLAGLGIGNRLNEVAGGILLVAATSLGVSLTGVGDMAYKAINAYPI